MLRGAGSAGRSDYSAALIWENTATTTNAAGIPVSPVVAVNIVLIIVGYTLFSNILPPFVKAHTRVGPGAIGILFLFNTSFIVAARSASAADGCGRAHRVARRALHGSSTCDRRLDLAVTEIGSLAEMLHQRSPPGGSSKCVACLAS